VGQAEARQNRRSGTTPASKGALISFTRAAAVELDCVRRVDQASGRAHVATLTATLIRLDSDDPKIRQTPAP
jgi:hypothetical protein